MQKQSFNKNWVYGEKAAVTDLTGVKGELKEVTLPHDAAFDQERDPDMENGYQKAYFPDKAYQYEKCWDVPEDWKDKSVYLEFEGVFRDAEVLLNKNAVTRKHMGYTGFCVCLDDYLDYGKANTVTVTAKSGKEQHWYSGTGIYRPVNLMVGSLLHFAPNAIKITPVDITDDSAVAIVESKIRNKNHSVQRFQLHTEVCDQNGRVVGEETILVTLKGHSETTCRQRIALQQIRCWSPESPELYVCNSSIVTEDGIIDSEKASFGIRRISVDAKHGFCLNGKEIKLRGACIHHDAGIIGAIANKSAEKRRIQKLKEAGFNAVRMAHNPSSTAILEACDEEGMLVMEESFNVWNVMRFVDDYSSFFDDNWERDITETVEHAYNHPSVIMYSIGNEIQEIITTAGKELCRRIADKVHELDPYRYSTLAINGMVCVFSEMDKYSDTTAENSDINQAMVDIGEIMSMIMLSDTVGDGISECADAVDIAGYNYMQARYELDTAAHPNRVIVGSETHPRDIDQIWGLVKKYPNVIGDFSWVGWNYLGEAGIGMNNYGEAKELATSYLGEYPWIGSACGDFDIIGNRLPISYFREIVYGIRKDPYIAVLDPSHYGELIQTSPWGWEDSYSGWTWNGYEGKMVQVDVYADADEVVLLKNGEEIGRGACHEGQRFRIRFETAYEPGTLEAKAFVDGKLTGSYRLSTAEAGEHLAVTAESDEVEFNEGNLLFIDVTMADANGTTVHSCNPTVTLDVEGNGKLLGFGSGAAITEERFDDNIHTMHDGRLLAVIRPTGTGTVTVSAHADGYEDAKTSIIIR